jgi:F-type H+-transporting ATPase subunit epsilon
MKFINFQLVTPERTVLSTELTSLTCQTSMGQITILPGHAPLVANLVAGELHAKSAEGESFIFVAGGFVEVKESNNVIILADAAEHHHEIDLQKAEEAKVRAEKAVREEKLSSTEYAKAASALEQSLVKINISRKHAHRRNSPMSNSESSN